MDYSCVVIILFNMSLYKSAFSTYSFGKLVFQHSVFSALPALFFGLNIVFIVFVTLV